MIFPSRNVKRHIPQNVCVVQPINEYVGVQRMQSTFKGSKPSCMP